MYLTKELKTAICLAKQAAKEILEVYESDGHQVMSKEDKTPLTQADLRSNKVIVEGLHEAFPQDAIMSEEEVDNKERLTKQRVWIIDPLDGTKEFIKRNGEFTVNIGLVVDGRPVLGVIYAPVLDELYFAADGLRSSLIKDGKTKTLHVSDKKEIAEFILVKSRSHPNETLSRFIDSMKLKHIVTLGSSLKGCSIATAQADVYPRFNAMWEWDVCAMHVIVVGAGGTVTDLRGNELTYNKELPKHEQGFMMSNSQRHKEMLNGQA